MTNHRGINTQKLRDYRLRLGLSQNGLDKKAQVGARTTHNAEEGKGITVATLKALAEALGVPAAIFLD